MNSGKIQAADLSNAFGFIGGIAKTAKRLLDTREEIKVNEVAIQLQGIALDLQSEMMMVQASYQEVLRSREDLEKQLVQYEDWEKERQRYELRFVGDSTFAYTLKAEHETGQQKHWLCTNCYERKQKSILQKFNLNAMQCPSCNMVIHPRDWPMWVPNPPPKTPLGGQRFT